MKDYNKLLQERVDQSFNKILIVTSILAYTASWLLAIADLPIWYSVLNFSVGSVMLVFYFLAEKINPAVKIVAFIFVTSLVAVASFIGGGFTSAFITMIVIANVIATLFLKRKLNRIITIYSILLMCALCAYSIIIDVDGSIVDPFLTWGLQLVAYILFLAALQISVYATKSYLMENIDGLEVAVQHSNELAYYDQLTKLPNEHKFKLDVEKLIKENKGDGFIIFFNLKSLGLINSTLGQEFGNQTLIEAAEIFGNLGLKHSFAARTAGNEFAIWADHISEEALHERFLLVMDVLKKESVLLKKKLEFYASYSKFTYGKDTFEACYQRSALTLTYVINNNISGLVPYEDQLEVALRRKESIKDAIEMAIENEQIDLHYQPKYDSRTNKVVGVEALARWENDALGCVPPNEFIPIIESLNMAVKFGDFVIHRTFRDYKTLQEKFGKEVNLSINISPSHLIDTNIVTVIEKALEVYDVPDNRITIEITEEIVIKGIDQVKPILKALRDLNVKISLDDFGTGYSSLNYLTQLEIDELKIDKSFIDQIGEIERIDLLIESILHLATLFNLETIAEGVETRDQLDKLMSLDCFTIQGYYYDKPKALHNL